MEIPSGRPNEANLRPPSVDKFGFYTMVARRGMDLSVDSLGGAGSGEESKREGDGPLKRRTLVRKENSRTLKWLDMMRATQQAGQSVTAHPKFVSRLEKGVPSAVRAAVWKEMALQVEERSALMATPSSPPSEETMRAISLDLARTFPTHAHFSKPAGHALLEQVLVKAAEEDSEVGFCQGMSFVAGVLLVVMPSADAQLVFRVLLRSPQFAMRDLYRASMPGVWLRLYQFEQVLEQERPRLYEHFTDLNFVPGMYASQWVLTLFAYSFPFDVVVRTWDLMLLRGWSIFFGVAVAVLQEVETKLLFADLDGVARRLRSLSGPGEGRLNTDRVMKRAIGIASGSASPQRLAAMEQAWCNTPQGASLGTNKGTSRPETASTSAATVSAPIAPQPTLDRA